MAESDRLLPIGSLLAPLASGAMALGAVVVPFLDAAKIPQRISGRAIVIDGDTLDVEGVRIRLEGIDAPEAGQTCPRRWSGTWSCGSAASLAVSRLIGSRSVDCKIRGHDRYGRMLGVCTVEGREVNAEMVRSGYAWPFVRYSTAYVAEEAQARAQRAGIWEAETEPAWVYREKRRKNAEVGAPNGCAIKGNVTARGHIYHMPRSPWYGKVKIEAAKGERWFCSEAEAREAGWRPAAFY